MRRRWRWAGAPLLLAALIGAFAPPAGGDPLHERRDEIERKTEEIEGKLDRLSARREGILGRIHVFDEARQEVEADVAALDGEIDRLDTQINKVQRDLIDAQLEVARLSERLQVVLGRLEARRSIFVERAVAAYVAGPAAYLDGLLTSESFAQLIDRYEYHESSLDADAKLVEEIEILRQEVDGRRALVEQRQAQIAADKLRLEEDRRRIASVREERADALARLENVLQSKRMLLDRVERNRAHFQAVQAQLERESDRISSLLAVRAAATTPGRLPTGGGTLLWPADGPITSGYGWRTHPVFGDRRFHAGIDIGAPYGAPVIAADRGEVAYVGTMSGYGNTIVIDHGRGLATTYNHLSAFSVGSGERVARGAPIGAVGCSGYCTGPHLHFEVRVNGSPVDPMPYLR